MVGARNAEAANTAVSPTSRGFQTRTLSHASFWGGAGPLLRLAGNRLQALVAAHGVRPAAAHDLSKLKVVDVDPHRPATLKEYRSAIPSVSPEVAFEQTLARLPAAFAAGRVTVVRDWSGPLQSGDRFYLLSRGPSMLAPCQIQIDRANRTIRIQTLEGHIFQGTNEFKFVSGENGGTSLVQTSKFQPSSVAVAVGDLVLSRKQTDIWKGFHAWVGKNVGK
jgi:hypothetical protein